MDVFALLFIASFLAVVVTLAVMYIRKHIKVKDDVDKGAIWLRMSLILYLKGILYESIYPILL